MGVKSDFQIVFLVCLAAGFLLLIFGIGNTIVLIPLYGMFYMVMASAGVIQEEYVQQTIDEQGRSTVHSIISLLHNIYGILFFVIVGLFVSNVGIPLGVTLISNYMLILCMLLYVMHRFHVV